MLHYPSTVNLLHKAHESLASGDLEQALCGFTGVLSINASDCEAYHGRAKAYFRQGAYEHALADASSAIVLSDGYHHYFHYQGSLQHKSRGDLYAAEAEVDKAMADYEKAMFLDHNNMGALHAQNLLTGRGSHVALGDYHTAIELDIDYYRVIKRYDIAQLVPDEKAASEYLRAHSYGQHGQYREALAAMDKAIMHLPTSAALFHDRGCYNLHLGAYGCGISDYSEAITLDSTHSNAYYGRGTCFWHQQKRRPALQDYDDAIRLSTMKHEAYHHQASQLHAVRGEIYGRIGEIELAINDYTKAIDLNRQHVDAYFNRGELYAGKENYQSAMSDYRAVLSLSPDHHQAREGHDAIKNRFLIS